MIFLSKRIGTGNSNNERMSLLDCEVTDSTRKDCDSHWGRRRLILLAFSVLLGLTCL
jgi:hypothetical protein